MITCEFVFTDNFKAKCIRCGNSIEILDGMTDLPAFPCRSSISNVFKNGSVSTPLVKNLVSNETTDDQKAREQCSDEQIQQRYEICKNCIYFSNNTCQECGCVLSRDRIFLNKLAWKDESCPKSKW